MPTKTSSGMIGSGPLSTESTEPRMSHRSRVPSTAAVLAVALAAALALAAGMVS